MAPPHRVVPLMAALAAAVLLLTLDVPVTLASVENSPAVMEDRVSQRSPHSVKPISFAVTEAERVNTLKVLQAFAAAMPSLGWSGDDFCSWSGVTCLDANVSIMITDSGVTGTLPEMPDDVVYSMVKLDVILMLGEHSGIRGTLPSSWGKLHKVRTVSLGHTAISGTLPAAWSSMAAVEEIVITSRNVSGALPESWSSLRNLWEIYLQGCSLYGSLPESWARMPSLERLDLRKNKFCGCVPETWLMSRTLRVEVDTRHTLPQCMRAEACVETRTPEPMGSSVSSTATRELSTLPPPSRYQCKVPNCNSCLLGNSNLCLVCSHGYMVTEDRRCVNGPEWEAVPLAMSESEWWNTLKVLQAFAAAMPSLGWSGGDFCSWRCVRCTDGNAGFVVSKWWVSGTLPEMPDDVDYSMVRLEEISIFSQQRGITGTLPSSWGKLRTVRTINLAYAAITGTLPSSWGKLRKVRTINVAYTAITGTLPESWGKLREVRTINLAYTGITGTLPSSWGKLRKVQTINLSYTGISGTLPSAWSSMETIEQIIFSSSQISGTLPQAWGSMPNLRRVDLQRCSLYGPFPESWVQMPSLERLELRNNDFCGCVPESWLRSPILLMAVDVWHRMASCATADACTDVASTQNSTSNSDDQDG